MSPGAPEGARLPRRRTSVKRSRETIEGLAFQFGVIVAIERNRRNLNESELAALVGTDQLTISAIETGKPAGGTTDGQLASLFDALGLAEADLQASFLGWWRGHG